MSHHPTALGGTCSGRFDPLRELFKMRRLCACLTIIALAGALSVRAEDAPAKSLAIYEEVCVPSLTAFYERHFFHLSFSA
jgi:hypothetical protein